MLSGNNEDKKKPTVLATKYEIPKNKSYKLHLKPCF